MLRLAVVIVNYRTPRLVLECLESLVPQLEPGLDRAVVVDNASEDGSHALIAEAIEERGWSASVELRTASRNAGFAAGNNLGVDALEARYYLFLNSDTLVRSGALTQLLHAASEQPRSGIIGARLEWPDETPQVSCFRDHSPLSELLHSAGTGPLTRCFPTHEVPLPVCNHPVEVQWASLACALVRAEVLRQVGPMDEDYFLFFEDADYCRRARMAGWDILYWPDARVVHLRGGSGPVKAFTAQRKRLPTYYYESRARYFAKFYGARGLLAANILWLLGRAIAWPREILGLKDPGACRLAWWDIWRVGAPRTPPSNQLADGRE